MNKEDIKRWLRENPDEIDRIVNEVKTPMYDELNQMFEEIRDDIKAIGEKDDELKALRERKKEKVEKFNNSLKGKILDEKTNELLNEIYWGNYFGITKKFNIIKSVECVCRICGCKETLNQQAKTIVPIPKGWNKEKDGLLCKWCYDDLKEKERKERAERLQKEKDRIQELKTMPYLEYLQTDHWKEIRKKKLGKAWYKCEKCQSKKDLHVHHITYARRGEERMSDLEVLCKDCHEKAHNIAS